MRELDCIGSSTQNTEEALDLPRKNSQRRFSEADLRCFQLGTIGAAPHSLGLLGPPVVRQQT